MIVTISQLNFHVTYALASILEAYVSEIVVFNHNKSHSKIQAISYSFLLDVTEYVYSLFISGSVGILFKVFILVNVASEKVHWVQTIHQLYVTVV